MMNDVSQVSLILLLILTSPLVSVFTSGDGLIGERGMEDTESLSSGLGDTASLSSGL